MLKNNRFSLTTLLKFGNLGTHFMLFVPTIVITSYTFQEHENHIIQKR